MFILMNNNNFRGFQSVTQKYYAQIKNLLKNLFAFEY